MTDDNKTLGLETADGKQAALDLLLNKGLYSSIDINDTTAFGAAYYISQANIGTFDCYCTTCGITTPFICEKMPVPNRGGGLRNGNGLYRPVEAFAVRTVCQRDLNSYQYVFYTVDNKLIKIGQFPSMADISFGELKGIDKGLKPVDRRELGQALGLFAHDAAAGAFVYLRRVFERIVDRAHQRNCSGPIENFDQKRMDEKINALRDFLPERMVKNRKVFSLLSRGVHELTDDQCQTLFPVVKAVIFEMLELEEHERRVAASQRQTDAALQAALASGLAGPDDEPEA